jgi:prepilin-type N-terminal cleavage/methylation domain-containing protein
MYRGRPAAVDQLWEVWIFTMEHNKNKGFTIVETMIAVVIFTLIASIATFVTIQLSRSYQYGISKSKLDTSARNVNYLFNQAVQYSNSTELMGSAVQPTDTSFGTLNTWKVWCAGTTRFSAQISGTVLYYNGLYRDTVNPLSYGSETAACMGTPLSSSKVQLIPNKASISLFEVSHIGSVFRLRTAFEMGQLSDFVGSNATTSLLSDANGNILPKLPVCQTQAFGSFSYCAIVYYDNSVTSFMN